MNVDRMLKQVMGWRTRLRNNASLARDHSGYLRCHLCNKPEEYSLYGGLCFDCNNLCEHVISSLQEKVDDVRERSSKSFTDVA